jgi:hypothetical protein
MDEKPIPGPYGVPWPQRQCPICERLFNPEDPDQVLCKNEEEP